MTLESQISKLTEQAADYLDDVKELQGIVDKKVQSVTQVLNDTTAQIDNKLKVSEQAVDAKVSEFQRSQPLAPNTLADTLYFRAICKDVPEGTPVDLFSSHGGPWTTHLWGGSEGEGTITKLNLPQLESHNLAPSQDMLNRAIGSGANMYGSDFKILLLDITITKGAKDRPHSGYFFALNQGCERFIGWGRGQFLTQASCWVNVLEHSGNITFHPSRNRSATITVDHNDVGKGWQYKHNHRLGWGGCHQPVFIGLGRMKVAICLPYVGTGNHGNNMIWADSVGYPYTHAAPSII